MRIEIDEKANAEGQEGEAKPNHFQLTACDAGHDTTQRATDRERDLKRDYEDPGPHD
jgi:hypothetical protein